MSRTVTMFSDADQKRAAPRPPIAARKDKVMANCRVAPRVAATLLGLAAAHPVGAEVLGSDPGACSPGAQGTAALVTIVGFKDRKGRLRVQNYRATPEEFLASGRYLRREQMPVTPAGDMTLCLPLPGAGAYAIVALHDRDSNGNLSVWSDGVGFSRNPRLGLSKPHPDATVMNFPAGVSPVRIVLNYRRGLSVRPLQ
jgi:uncharacterized protein (DUF2141 family)